MTAHSFLLFSFFFLMIRRPPRSTLFPSRRSSDLAVRFEDDEVGVHVHPAVRAFGGDVLHLAAAVHIDRKSTRLNSSHMSISYAVFCLKKKKKKTLKPTHNKSQTPVLIQCMTYSNN